MAEPSTTSAHSAPSTPTPATTTAAPSAPSAPTIVSMPNRPAAAPETSPSATVSPSAAPTQVEAPKAGEAQAPTPAVPSDPNAPQPTDFKLPDEYKDKPWAAKIKTQDDLYKQLDNLDKLVGKKAIPPDLAKATPEEREAFYAQLRPATVDEYQFPDTGMPLPPEIKTAIGDMFMKNGVSAVQANDIIKEYNKLGEQQQAALFDPKQFETTLEQAFGKEWKPVIANIQTSLKGMMSEADLKALDNLPNAYLATVYRTLGNVVQKYGVRETDTAHFQGAGNPQPQDLNVVRDGIRKELASLSSRPHSASEIAALRTKLADTYKNDPRLQGAQ